MLDVDAVRHPVRIRIELRAVAGQRLRRGDDQVCLAAQVGFERRASVLGKPRDVGVVVGAVVDQRPLGQPAATGRPRAASRRSAIGRRKPRRRRSRRIAGASRRCPSRLAACGGWSAGEAAWYGTGTK